MNWFVVCLLFWYYRIVQDVAYASSEFLSVLNSIFGTIQDAR